MTAFSYVGLISLLWVWNFSPFSTQLCSWGVVSWEVCTARISSLVSFFSWGLFFGLPVFRGFVLSNFQGCFDILSSFFGFVLRPLSLEWFCWFQFFWGLIFPILLRAFSWVFFYRAFLYGSVLSSTPHVELPCLLRMHAINSCVGDAWQRLTGWFHP